MRLIGLAVVLALLTLALMLGLMAAPLAADPQTGKVYRVGVLTPGIPSFADSYGPFYRGLRELGYVGLAGDVLYGSGWNTLPRGQ